MDRFVEMQHLHTTILQQSTPDGLVQAQGRGGQWQVSHPWSHEAQMWSGTVEQIRARLANLIDARVDT